MIEIFIALANLLCLFILFRYIKQVNDRVTATRKWINSFSQTKQASKEDKQ